MAFFSTVSICLAPVNFFCVAEPPCNQIENWRVHAFLWVLLSGRAFSRPKSNQGFTWCFRRRSVQRLDYNVQIMFFVLRIECWQHRSQVLGRLVLNNQFRFCCESSRCGPASWGSYSLLKCEDSPSRGMKLVNYFLLRGPSRCTLHFQLFPRNAFALGSMQQPLPW